MDSVVENSQYSYPKVAHMASDKVIFSGVCVVLFIGGGGLCMMSMMSLSAWLPGPMFLQGGLCPGGLCPPGQRSPTREERAVRILLECFLVQLIVDINECLVDNGGCAEMCTNVLGSFRCSCRTGYRLNVDGKSCDGTLCYKTLIVLSLTKTL